MRAMLYVTFSILMATSHVYASEFKLRLGHAVFETHPFHDAALRFKRLVEEKSKGSVEIDIYPARQLGTVAELMQGVRLGTVDMAISDVSANYDSAPDLQAWQLPWLIRDYAHLADLVQTKEAVALADQLLKDGVLPLAYYEGGQHSFFSRNGPIKRDSDFAGLKVRTAPVRIQLEYWQQLGANPTPVDYGEIYSALETGVLDALGINITSVFSEKYYEVVKDATMTRHFFWPALLLVNEKTFSSLTPEYQQLIRDAAVQVSRDQILAVGEAESAIIEKLKSVGVRFHGVSPELHDRLVEQAQPLYAKYGQISPAVQAFIAAAE
ncbi:TRAP transporter substrate-binding protein [Sinorhizobium medicae]|uniref:TRAP transporter substrate-binding protein n=1 Tax=Sinorhizobium TaxID=28105 RepID=UPI000FD7E966|nr:TRAP transporter substrate-binding protein [Sinorhizobium medicae]MDW9500529.1 DctP family TRAP transporter solute-binding subunit [Sinorhizobium meliloti]MDX0018747.1 DctP family TRAP transporter solute-binding subunit [Sinorhizobium meliloti]RVH85875.1 TRAP transporter substrate-binding protein [Sinorhizobium medicae]RVP59993.1 TRAP transporter substrate-binding protein [Sinorhizobium medicae]